MKVRLVKEFYSFLSKTGLILPFCPDSVVARWGLWTLAAPGQTWSKPWRGAACLD